MTGEHAVRPWGPIEWCLPRMRPRSWTLLGGLGAEPRWSTAGRLLHDAGQLSDYLLFEIHDAPAWGDPGADDPERIPLRFEKEQERALDISRRQFLRCGGDEAKIERIWLMETDDIFVNRAMSFRAASGPSVVLDISTMPKRFFFPILRALMEDAAVVDLAVAYTSPANYGKQLAVDPEDCISIPRFDSRSPHDGDRVVIVAAGFEQHGVVELFKREPGETVGMHVILPFPASSSSVRKSWEFIRGVQQHLPEESREPVRIDPADVSGAFDFLRAMTRNGEVHATLGPYGPKTLSLAMCIFAVQSNRAVVLYSQPTSYSPRYSSGVAVDAATGFKKSYLYPVRLDGRDLYSLGETAHTPPAG